MIDVNLLVAYSLLVQDTEKATAYWRFELIAATKVK